MVTISSNMNVSDIIRIFEKIEDEYGDIEVVGECDDCTSSDMNIFILTADKPIHKDHKMKCWIQVSTPEK